MNEGLIEWLKILEIILIASVKFLFSPFEAERQGFSYRESLIITTTGGVVGILMFTFIGEGIAYSWKKIQSSSFGKSKSRIKKFNRLTRLVISIKNKFGVMGVSMITPSLISIPVGTLIINRLYKGKFKNLLVLFFALLIWSLTLNSIAYYLRLSQYLVK